LAAGRLPGAEAEALLDRVMGDRELLREYELLRAIHQAGRSPAVWSPSRGRFAVAASVVLLVGSVFVWRLTQAPGPEGTLRGGGGLQILAPQSGAPFSGTEPLVWSGDPDAWRYRVEVVDQFGVLVAVVETADTTLALPDGTFTAGGAFTWWVEANVPGGVRRSGPGRFEVP